MHRGAGGVIAPELVTQAVEREAARPDNQAKLAAVPDAKHRHLFVIHTVESRSLAVHALIGVRDGRGTSPADPDPPDVDHDCLGGHARRWALRHAAGDLDDLQSAARTLGCSGGVSPHRLRMLIQVGRDSSETG